MYGGPIHTPIVGSQLYHKFAFDILMTISSCSLFLALMLCILLFIIKNMILKKDSPASLIYQRDSWHQNGMTLVPSLRFISSHPVYLSRLCTPSVALPSASEYLHILVPPSIFQVLCISANAWNLYFFPSPSFFTDNSAPCFITGSTEFSHFLSIYNHFYYYIHVTSILVFIDEL